ncbi:MAG: VIT and VWA domain-containing protein [Acidobacteriota bacterium]|nr:VIT and VWA domain-containing protein [Acidobacteriota bacterium]
MRFKNATSFFCLLFISFSATISANAQGVVIPIVCDVRPCRPIPRPLPVPNALPVKSIQLDTKINGQVATTHVEQIFRNDTPYTLEGTYFFPIPETASIVEFAIWENGKKLVGEVRSREEARRIYDEIVRRQRDPGLLEYAGKDLFQASIFPIPPNSDKKLEITYSQILKAESGTVAYRYPLGTGRNLWRNPRPVPMVEEDTSGYGKKPINNQKFGTISGKIEITGNEALRNIYSPSHKIEVSRKGEKNAVVSFETSGSDSDFQLFYGLSNNDFGMSLLTYREAGKDGYFLLQLSPKDNLTEKELADKDIVFVLDTSGSMAEEGKMEKARAALLFGIGNLREGDRFNVINFAGEEHLMESRMISANSQGKRRGEEFVKKLAPTGGTNINDALRAALRQFDASDRPKMLVFLTDGLPTVGESNVEKIIANAKSEKVEGLRLFTFGVGYDVNTRLLDKLASENSGVADYVEPKEDLEVKVSNFFTKVNSPVLTGLEMDFGNVETDLLYPRELSDIFKGSQLTLIGRYKNSSELEKITLRLKGKTGKEIRTFEYKNLDFPMRAESNSFLPRLWATRRVGWLVEQIRSNGENKELRDEIVDLGTRYGIVTPYTSYLATDGSERTFADSSANSSMQNLPINGRTVMKRAAPKPTISAEAVSGQGAVRASKDAQSQQETVTVTSGEDEILKTGTVKKTGAKTFYLEAGVWTDSEFKAESKMPEIKLRFASNEFFDLINKEKDLAQYFALGEQVVVVWKGKVYRIVK